MKYPVLIFAIFLLTACATKKSTKSESAENQKTNCPTDGVCSFEVFQGKQFNIKKDEFGNTYPLIESGEKILLKFTYKRNSIENTADSDYSEIVFAEVDENSIENLSISDKALDTVKLTFGKVCFCRGQNGYYPIRNGTLTIEKVDEDKFIFNLDFEANGVDPIISQISEKFNLKL
ncbi:MAG: hypothetical protein AAF688_13715 [Bacteroidota bacterium]